MLSLVQCTTIDGTKTIYNIYNMLDMQFWTFAFPFNWNRKKQRHRN